MSGSDGATYKLAATGGTQSVTPSVTTTYTATATGPSGSITATASVSVGAAAAPTVQILANPTSDAAGSTSTLTVTATNATQVIVTGTDGSTYTLGPTGGTLPVTPSVTTTYTATATGAGGTITATAKVTVVPPMTPTVTISANPTTITTPGNWVILTVTATNATSVVLTGNRWCESHSNGDGREGDSLFRSQQRPIPPLRAGREAQSRRRLLLR